MIEIIELLYDELKETLDSRNAIKAICICGSAIALGAGAGLIAIASLCGHTQPIIIINDINNIKEG